MWTDEILRGIDTMNIDTMNKLCWHIRVGHMIRGFLSWCKISSIRMLTCVLFRGIVNKLYFPFWFPFTTTGDCTPKIMELVNSTIFVVVFASPGFPLLVSAVLKIPPAGAQPTNSTTGRAPSRLGRLRPQLPPLAGLQRPVPPEVRALRGAMGD